VTVGRDVLRAQGAGLTNLRSQQGDATARGELADKSFDLVVSIFGAMFAPKPFDVAKEMVRVTRPGGRIVMGNWIPGDPTLVAQILKISSSYSPPPPEGFISPMTWGIENNVIERFAGAGVTKEKNSDIETGTLQCTACHSKFEITKHIPRFVPMDNYARGFGFQWNTHARTQHDSHSGTKISETRFFKETKWPRDMRGEYILEVGCGAGRFTAHAASTGAFVVSMDYSSAVDANFSVNGHLENVLIVQADVYHMPFRTSFFDRVFCLGVLQHTPNVEGAFRCLATPLKPGGRLAIDVYRKPKGRQRLLDTKYHIRPLTKRLPSRFLYTLCKAYTEVMWPVAKRLRKLPRGRRMNQILLIEDSLGKTAEKARKAVLKNLAAWAEQRGRRVEAAPKRNQIVFRAAGSMEEKERARRLAGNEDVTKGGWRFGIHSFTPFGRVMAGSTASMRARERSIQAGRRRWLPNSASDSSVIKPGRSVAISKRIPPGSRK
jgi:SAM-dependent methyltransferase